jgi:hypothetical protein
MLLFQQNTGICTMLGQKGGLYAPLNTCCIPSLPVFSSNRSCLIGCKIQILITFKMQACYISGNSLNSGKAVYKIRESHIFSRKVKHVSHCIENHTSSYSYRLNQIESSFKLQKLIFSHTG